MRRAVGRLRALGHPVWLLGGVSLGWTLTQTARYVLPPLLPAIVEDLGITLTAAGIVLTVHEFVHAALQYPGGRLSDQWGRPALILPGLAVMVASLALLATTPGYLALLVGAAAFGVGRGLYNVPARALIADHFVAHRGRAMGVFATGTDLGGMAGSGLAVAALAIATWRLPFGVLAGAIAGFALLFVVLNREPYAVGTVSLELRATARRLLATRRGRETLLAYSLFMFVATGVVNFLPAYLQQQKGLSPTLAGSGFALFFVVGVLVKPPAGALSDRLPRRTVAAGGLVVGAVALGALVLGAGLGWIALAIAVFAVGYKAQFPVLDAILMDAAPDGSTGGDLGAAKTVFFGIGSLGATYVGFVAETWSYDVAFAGLAAALVASAVILARHRRGQG